MKNNEIKSFINVTIFITALVWAATFALSNQEGLSIENSRWLFTATTISAAFWVCFFKWLWKWSPFKFLMFRPNLNGTWIGEFASTWKNENQRTEPPGHFVLVIRQSFFSISIIVFTEKSKTESHTEVLTFDKDRGKKTLSYFFEQKNNASIAPDTRDGAAELHLSETGKKPCLEGGFWTKQGTRGAVSVYKVSNSPIESFKDARKSWPVSETWAKVNSQSILPD